MGVTIRGSKAQAEVAWPVQLLSHLRGPAPLLIIERIPPDEFLGAVVDDPPLIAICGDFNAEAGEVPLRTICGHVEDTGNPAHGPRVIVACEHNVAESRRYSLWHLGRGEMIDHILVSRTLLATLDATEIHNEYLPAESGAFRDDTKFPESDHAPVIAQFTLDPT